MDLEKIESKIINVQGQHVILDSDVAELYGVETKHVNQAIKNNPDKFPEGYIIELSEDEMKFLRSKFLTLENPGRGKYGKYNAKGFTERGLYMIATILKSPSATETTIAIIETFAKVRELARTVNQIAKHPNEFTQESVLQQTGHLIAEIVKPPLAVTDTETTLELNIAIFSVKHTVKRSSGK
jgi:hypothetical protein